MHPLPNTCSLERFKSLFAVKCMIQNGGVRFRRKYTNHPKRRCFRLFKTDQVANSELDANHWMVS